MTITALIAQRLGIRETQVEHTIKLLDEGATIPFIARYRKEATGNLDEVVIAAIADENAKLLELQHRKEYVIETIDGQGKLTPELRKRIEDSWDATEVEDIYLPFKPKRRTRAQMAREKGLEPLATILQLTPWKDPELEAEKYLSDQVETVEDALAGARDIIAEQVSEDEKTRNQLRNTFRREAYITSKLVKGKDAEEEAAKFRDYYDWSEPLKRCSSHRLLAMRRGENLGILRVTIAPQDDEQAIERIGRPYIHEGTPAAKYVKEAVADAYKRLLKPSIETEFAAQSKQAADEEAIRVFAANLKQLLLAAPLGQKRIMGIDPGFRTGCKVVCLDAQGALLHNETIYPHEPKREYTRASMTLRHLMEAYRIEAVAIGTGTAGRETDQLVRDLGMPGVEIFLVSEDGASVYSASKLARDEFPDYDVTVRGAVSIGRRLADPLAELVKIDPKSIGVGQYQHDVDQSALKHSLDLTVESCVNSVGVNLNTASQHLLTYVSGLGPALAKNIVDFRTENGPFASRRQLLKVPRLGNKAFEQCAGFLRITDAKNPLDNTAVHPERYALVEQMAKDAGLDVPHLIADADARKRIPLKNYCTAEVGMPTLTDIMAELDKPGRDPRGTAKVFSFNEKIRTIDDLERGMILPGVVTNVTNFGAFVDLGIKIKGLVHVSQIANRRIADPAEVLSIQQHVNVRVLEIDYDRKRISLSMKGVEQE
ncbi:MAG: Tex family protein [Bacteroidales bacterium]|nr:Tex family protein [Bacteroidales bacterium]